MGLLGFQASTGASTRGPMGSQPACHKCGLKRGSVGPCQWWVPQDQPSEGGLLVVHGYPVDKGAGQQQLPGPLATMLHRIGADMHRVPVATALACTPGHAAQEPGPEQLAACRPQLAATIKALRPTTIITYGQQATSSVVSWLWGEEAGYWRRWAGYHIPDQTLNAWICPVGRGTAVTPQVDEIHFYNDLRAAWAKAEKGLRPWPVVPDFAAQVQRIYDPADAAQRLRAILATSPRCVAFDYEATGLKPEAKGQRLVSCAVAWTYGNGLGGCIAYPWLGEAVAATRELLVHPVPKVGANTKFEERWSIAKLGTRVRNWYWCTMLAAHWDKPQQDVNSFKLQAYAHLGQPYWAAKVHPYLTTDGPSQLNRIDEVPLPELLLYNGLDAALELLVAYRQMKKGGYPLP